MTASQAAAAAEPVIITIDTPSLGDRSYLPDLLGREHTHELVHHQFDSAHRLADELPDLAEVLPTHGFGSFCSPGSSGAAASSTIGKEKRSNPALTTTEEDWVEQTLAGLEAYPAYYVHLAPANRAGPLEPDLSAPRTAGRDAIAASITAGEWVVDLPRWAASIARTSPTSPRSATTAAWSSWTSDASPSTPVATVPPSPHRFWPPMATTSSPSTTTSLSRPACP
jgi:hypothetical protein